MLAFALLLLFLLSSTAPAAFPSGDTQAPIPEVHALIAQVQAHQRDLDKTRENYTYRELQTVDELDKNGKVKKTERRESQVFYVHSHPVERLVAKDGAPLSASDEARESERIRKEVEKAERTPPGQMVDNRREVSITRLLSIEHFSNPRRLEIDHRSVLAYDFAGDPDAHAHGVAENATKKLAGTLWIDEKDKEVRRVEATLQDNFHAGFGLFALNKGSSFAFDQQLVNNELWLPTSAAVHLQAHAMAFLNYHADVRIRYDSYQRFHADAQPGSQATLTHQQ